MELGVNTWLWEASTTVGDLTELAPRAADMGFDLIEIPLEEPGAIDYERASTIVADNDLAVSTAASITDDRDLIHEDETVRENGVEYLRRCIDATATLGGTNLVGGFYSAPGRTWRLTPDEREETLDELAALLSPLAEYAADRGVTLCLEPINRYRTSVINTAEQGIDLVDRVDHPAFRLMLDTYHMNIEETDVGDAIRSAGSRLHHVHAVENDLGTPGSGQVPWREVASALRSVDYDGPVVIESFTPHDERTASALSVWRPLASSQDALADEGETFLGRLFDDA